MFEQQLQQQIFRQPAEKTFIDKILAKDTTDQLQNIIKKSPLSREDMLTLLYLCSGTEAKLENFSEWDRYIILKFFVWIREFVKVGEIIFDIKEDLEKLEKNSQFKMTERCSKILNNCTRMHEHNIKFLVDLYLNISRTTLSLGATGFLEILKNKFEISYQGLPKNEPVKEEKAKLFSFGK